MVSPDDRSNAHSSFKLMKLTAHELSTACVCGIRTIVTWSDNTGTPRTGVYPCDGSLQSGNAKCRLLLDYPDTRDTRISCHTLRSREVRNP